MELITHADIAAVASAFHQPRVLTHDLVGRLAESNAAARALRALGFRVTREDPFPNDGGHAILLVDLNGLPADRLLAECDASTIRAGGHITGLYRGIRIVVQEDLPC
ncbi:Uncharacterised protein [Bordetella ansorpii]|uniref:Uncharacterized protein n=1 Tax=Bordetella ansorpii TaxID=288768 RepID=A0A157SW73_9BORD|nr:hypothetical protein [Bordetella ansorpii]SAI74591.1 Uncharacterised protein [Bordetella ansorpii]